MDFGVCRRFAARFNAQPLLHPQREMDGEVDPEAEEHDYKDEGQRVETADGQRRKGQRPDHPYTKQSESRSTFMSALSPDTPPLTRGICLII